MLCPDPSHPCHTTSAGAYKHPLGNKARLSQTAALEISQVVGEGNTSVNYTDSSRPYHPKLLADPTFVDVCWETSRILSAEDVLSLLFKLYQLKSEKGCHIDFGSTWVSCDYSVEVKTCSRNGLPLGKTLALHIVKRWNDMHRHTPIVIPDTRVGIFGDALGGCSDSDFMECFKDVIRVVLNATEDEFSQLCNRWKVTLL